MSGRLSVKDNNPLADSLYKCAPECPERCPYRKQPEMAIFHRNLLLFTEAYRKCIPGLQSRELSSTFAE